MVLNTQNLHNKNILNNTRKIVSIKKFFVLNKIIFYIHLLVIFSINKYRI